MKEDDVSNLYSELLRNCFANRKQTNLKGMFKFQIFRWPLSEKFSISLHFFVYNTAYDSKYDA